ncbi:hypothetical protein CR513_36490, partial [Mucuna pruriens]
MEDQTIEDIDEVKKSTPEKDNSLSDEEQEMSQDENLGNTPEPPLFQLRRSNRTNIDYSVIVRVQFILIRIQLFILDPKLTKVHIDDNGANMMTKMVPRGKFEACCEIVGLAIASTYMS